MDIRIREMIEHLERHAPKAYQESYDNAGLIVGDAEAIVRGVLVCLDSTEAVVEEALRLGCNVIVAHHPIIFKGLKTLTGGDYVQRTVMAALRGEVAIYAMHTNLDNVYHRGVNARIAERMGLVDTELLAPRAEPYFEARPQAHDGKTRFVAADATSGTVGSGMIGRLPTPMEELDFLTRLRDWMKTPLVRHTVLLGKPVRRVAVCGGSGGSLLSKAIARGADVFVSADFKYHDFFDADGKIVIADIGHFESEQFTIELLAELISEKFTNFATHCAKVSTNPVRYLF
jgi:dinuclear metal center YbgI/SA1388 family protein